MPPTSAREMRRAASSVPTSGSGSGSASAHCSSNSSAVSGIEAVSRWGMGGGGGGSWSGSGSTAAVGAGASASWRRRYPAAALGLAQRLAGGGRGVEGAEVGGLGGEHGPGLLPGRTACRPTPGAGRRGGRGPRCWSGRRPLRPGGRRGRRDRRAPPEATGVATASDPQRDPGGCDPTDGGTGGDGEADGPPAGHRHPRCRRPRREGGAGRSGHPGRPVRDRRPAGDRGGARRPQRPAQPDGAPSSRSPASRSAGSPSSWWSSGSSPTPPGGSGSPSAASPVATTMPARSPSGPANVGRAAVYASFVVVGVRLLTPAARRAAAGPAGRAATALEVDGDGAQLAWGAVAGGRGRADRVRCGRVEREEGRHPVVRRRPRLQPHRAPPASRWSAAWGPPGTWAGPPPSA